MAASHEPSLAWTAQPPGQEDADLDAAIVAGGPGALVRSTDRTPTRKRIRQISAHFGDFRGTDKGGFRSEARIEGPGTLQIPFRGEDRGAGHPTAWELDWEGASRPVGNEHPTQKPIEVFSIPMRKHTQPGDVCYEPFSGSGSQLIAGERLHRKVRAMEIQPAFVDVAIRRWQEATGKDAVLDGDGRTFAEIAGEREPAGTGIG
ncbi:MAG: DNA methyltransferase [Planctomycetota bacterium]